MKQTLSIVMLLTASLFLFSCKSKQKNEGYSEKDKEKEVENMLKKSKGLNAGSGNFDVTTPEGWDRIDTTEMGMKIIYLVSPQDGAGDNFKENINIVTEKTSGMSLENYLTLSKTNMQKVLTEFKEIEVADQTIDGLPGKAMQYQHDYSGIPLDVKVYAVIKEGVAYLINCTVPRGKLGNWMKPIDEVVESFKIN
jgi:hypothetical protein